MLQDEFACEMFEEIIRYHILCEHELCGSEATVSDHEGFSSHLNVEQMNKVISFKSEWSATMNHCLDSG